MDRDSSSHRLSPHTNLKMQPAANPQPGSLGFPAFFSFQEVIPSQKPCPSAICVNLVRTINREFRSEALEDSLFALVDRPAGDTNLRRDRLLGPAVPEELVDQRLVRLGQASEEQDEPDERFGIGAVGGFDRSVGEARVNVAPITRLKLHSWRYRVHTLSTTRR
jgi:hypothetical protein